MEDLYELLKELEKKFPSKDKKGRPTWVDQNPLTIGDLKELLRGLIDSDQDEE